MFARVDIKSPVICGNSKWVICCLAFRSVVILIGYSIIVLPFICYNFTSEIAVLCFDRTHRIFFACESIDFFSSVGDIFKKYRTVADRTVCRRGGTHKWGMDTWIVYQSDLCLVCWRTYMLLTVNYFFFIRKTSLAKNSRNSRRNFWKVTRTSERLKFR